MGHYHHRISWIFINYKSFPASMYSPLLLILQSNPIHIPFSVLLSLQLLMLLPIFHLFSLASILIHHFQIQYFKCINIILFTQLLIFYPPFIFQMFIYLKTYHVCALFQADYVFFIEG